MCAGRGQLGSGQCTKCHRRTVFGVAGRIGVEYNFWFPLQLSFDWRPVIGPEFGRHYDAGFSTRSLYSGGIALGVRYILN